MKNKNIVEDLWDVIAENVIPLEILFVWKILSDVFSYQQCKITNKRHAVKFSAGYKWIK